MAGGEGAESLQVTFALDGAGAQTMPAVPKHLPRVLGTPLPSSEACTVPSTPKTAPSPFYPTTPSKSRPHQDACHGRRVPQETLATCSLCLPRVRLHSSCL